MGPAHAGFDTASRLLPQDAVSLTDIGSGAGFPGLVLAILLVCQRPNWIAWAKMRVSQDVIDATEALPGCDQIEAFADESTRILWIFLPPVLAPLPKLCEMAAKLGTGVPVSKRGALAGWMTDARKGWKMQQETFESQTSPDARILRITHLARR